LTKVNIPILKTSKHTFFCENLDSFELPPSEAHHANSVLRLKPMDCIKIINGKGDLVIAEIKSISKKSLQFSVIEKRHQAKPNHHIHIAIAPTKSNDRIEFFLEKCTEIGISEITPILSKNSERKQIKIERWNKIITSAAKQSNNLNFPIINEMVLFNQFIDHSKNKDYSYFIAHCEDDQNKIELKDEKILTKKSCILIGPEGDFNMEEINLAKLNNFKPVSLGESRLRTETAGIIACHTLNLITY